jgi:hypothetical protein
MPHLRYRYVVPVTLNLELGLLDSLTVCLPTAVFSEQYCSSIRLKKLARGVFRGPIPFGVRKSDHAGVCILRKIAAVKLPPIAYKNQRRSRQSELL